ncbi:MAG TPA: hypothetical protein PKA36_17445, partial [Pseudoxanthomonas mexicana]|nr:hypothetical protein [Pseudoxanthomonas mexicana]
MASYGAWLAAVADSTPGTLRSRPSTSATPGSDAGAICIHGTSSRLASSIPLGAARAMRSAVIACQACRHSITPIASCSATHPMPAWWR